MGYSQIEEVDCLQTYTPTAKMTSLRMLMGIVVQEKLVVHQMDVKTPYLGASIDVELYIEQPEGFKVKEKESLVHTCIKT